MRGISSLVASALVCATTASVDAIVIDDFTVGPIHLERNAAVAITQVQTGLDPLHVLGGQREFILGEYYENGQTMTIDTVASSLTLAAAPFQAMAGLDVTYGSRLVPLATDLTAEGHDRFVLDFDGPISGPSRLRVTSFDGIALSEGVVNIGTFYTGKVAMIPFAAFGGVDFTNVASIELEFFRHRGCVLESFHTIPEPASAAMVLMLATAPILLRRRWY